MDAKWMVLDTKGRRHQPPTPTAVGGYFSCAKGRDGSCFGTERQAILWWVLFRNPIDVAEIVPPFQRSMRERCEKAVDDLWEKVRLMGDAEGGNGTGGTVEFVTGDDGAVDEQEWSADDCDAALDGIALALSAIQQMDDAAACGEGGDDDEA